MSRSSNSIKNAGTGIGMQIINVLLRFICRTAFVYTLGKEYLGIASLYTNVLTLLSITELGFSTAITYSLYDPLAKGDQKLICSLMAFYKKVYRIIGFIVLGLGLILMPFLPYLMTGVTDKVNIYLYYLLYLAQSVVSYWFFSYKSAIVIADQKKYVTDIICTFCQIAVCVLQVLALLLFRSFFLYTLLFIVMGIVQNIFIAWQADKRYPYLKEKAEPLTKDSKKKLFDQVHALFLQKISVVIGTATDNLIISSFVSVLAVGLYDNYHMIISSVQKFMHSAFQGLTASIGNLFTTESKERSAFIFRSLNLANSYLVCVASVCFLTLFQPFVTIWIGEEYLLDMVTVFIIVLNFATNFLQNIVLIYRDATGLFVVGRYRSAINAGLNLILSLIFVQFWGMTGVFLGSIISRLATNWWFDAWVLHKKGFEHSPLGYYLNCGICLIIMCFSWKCTDWICNYIVATDILLLILKGFLGVLLTSICYLLLYGGKKETKYLFGYAKKFYKKMKNKVCH